MRRRKMKEEEEEEEEDRDRDRDKLVLDRPCYMFPEPEFCAESKFHSFKAVQ